MLVLLLLACHAPLAYSPGCYYIYKVLLATVNIEGFCVIYSNALIAHQQSRPADHVSCSKLQRLCRKRLVPPSIVRDPPSAIRVPCNQHSSQPPCSLLRREKAKNNGAICASVAAESLICCRGPGRCLLPLAIGKPLLVRHWPDMSAAVQSSRPGNRNHSRFHRFSWLTKRYGPALQPWSARFLLALAITLFSGDGPLTIEVSHSIAT